MRLSEITVKDCYDSLIYFYVQSDESIFIRVRYVYTDNGES